MDDCFLNLIKELSESRGASGFETEVQKIIISQCKNNNNYKVDSLGNLYLFPKQYDTSKPTVLIEAHADEIGFIVKSIHSSGLIGIATIGSIIDDIQYGSSVQVATTNGDYIQGTITSVDPHFAKEARASFAKWVDIGASSKKEVEEVFCVAIGKPIVPLHSFSFSPKTGVMHGKSFDNRLGCAVLSSILQNTPSERPINIIGISAVQEEIGSRGVSFAMKNVNADIAICIEGSPADDAIMESNPQTSIGHGPMVRFMDRSMICKPALIEWANEIAFRFGLPIQLSVRSSGGTDAAVINNSYGIPSIVIGIPVRHTHSFHSIALLQDVISTKNLCERMVESLDHERIKNLKEVLL